MGYQILVESGNIRTRVTPTLAAESTTAFALKTMPTGITLKTRRPCAAKSRRVTILNGRFDPGLAYRDHLDLLNKIGITAPSATPTIADSGAGILIGIHIVYFSYVHKSGAELIHQSNLSPGSSASANLVNRQLTVSGLPTAAPAADPRVTHVRIWDSIDGDLPKFVVDLDFATLVASGGTYVYNIARGSTTPPVNVDGTLNSGARGVPPYTLYCIVWASRHWYFGDPANPQRAWYSLIDESESVDLVDQFLDTIDREAITGAGIQDNSLIITCSSAIYKISAQLTSLGTEFTMKKLSRSVGCISHHSIVNINHRLWWAAEDGVVMYDGTPHKMMLDLTSYWRTDLKAKLSRYRNCIGVNDTTRNTYSLLIPVLAAGDTAFYYVGHYAGVDPSLGGGDSQPAWVFKVRTRGDYTSAELFPANSDKPEIYVGGNDGRLRRENVYTDASDDSDSYLKKLIIRTKHYPFGSFFGGKQRGVSLKELMVYLKSAVNSWKVSLFGGSDSARDAALPTWGPYTFGPTLPASPTGGVNETEKLIRPTGVSGKGVTLEIQVDSPVGFEYRGNSLNAAKGPQYVGRT